MENLPVIGSESLLQYLAFQHDTAAGTREGSFCLPQPDCRRQVMLSPVVRWLPLRGGGIWQKEEESNEGILWMSPEKNLGK